MPVVLTWVGEKSPTVGQREHPLMWIRADGPYLDGARDFVDWPCYVVEDARCSVCGPVPASDLMLPHQHKDGPAMYPCALAEFTLRAPWTHDDCPHPERGTIAFAVTGTPLPYLDMFEHLYDLARRTLGVR